MQRGFTLIELLIVLAIIVTIAGMLIFMLAGARQESRRLRTVSQIRRINQVLTDKWEEVGLRPVRLSPASDAQIQATPPPNKLAVTRALKLNATRELQRLEFPDRITDLVFPPTVGTQTSTWLNYRLRVQALQAAHFASAGSIAAGWATIDTAWSQNFEGAECLYLILSADFDGDGNSLRFFGNSEIGDKDEDGMPEIWDQWNNPIEFIRWAPGYFSPLHEQDAVVAPDPFDPFKSDPRFATPGSYLDTRDGLTKPLVPFNLFPLVFSAGEDERYGVAVFIQPVHSDSGVRSVEFANLPPPLLNDPYVVDDAGQYMLGATGDFDGDGISGHEDNIDNHWDIR